MTWEPAGFSFQGALLNFVFFYPLLMAYVWMIGGVVHALFHERRRANLPDPLSLLPVFRVVSLLVRCLL